MTMWTSPEAINAELQYRRENLTRSATLIRTKRRRWGKRRGQAVPTDHVAPADGRAGQNGVNRTRLRREATVPAQRASGERPVTKQPA